MKKIFAVIMLLVVAFLCAGCTPEELDKMLAAMTNTANAATTAINKASPPPAPVEDDGNNEVIYGVYELRLVNGTLAVGGYTDMAMTLPVPMNSAFNVNGVPITYSFDVLLGVGTPLVVIHRNWEYGFVDGVVLHLYKETGDSSAAKKGYEICTNQITTGNPNVNATMFIRSICDETPWPEAQADGGKG